MPQSGCFSVNLPGVHIISLHSYVRPWGAWLLGREVALGSWAAQAAPCHSELPYRAAPLPAPGLLTWHVCPALPSCAAAALGQGIVPVPLAGEGPGCR